MVRVKSDSRRPGRLLVSDVLADGTIGLLYEQGEKNAYEKITFARFSLEWLTDGKDKLEK